MPTTIHDVLNFLNQIAPFSLQESYDNAGLITGHVDHHVTGIIVALDSTEDVILEAIQKNCNTIVAHHPIIFRGLKKINGNNYVERAVISAIKNDINIIAIHTNLDNILHQGVNERIAQQLQLTNVDILSKKDDHIKDIGSGLVGYLPTPVNEHNWLRHLQSTMGLVEFKHTRLLGKPIQKIGLCGGSGSFLIHKAIAAQCDVYISSDIKYHEYFDADNKIIICDIGHYESEKYTINLLYDLIINKFSNFAAHCTSVDTNPVYFFK